MNEVSGPKFVIQFSRICPATDQKSSKTVIPQEEQSMGIVPIETFSSLINFYKLVYIRFKTVRHTWEPSPRKRKRERERNSRLTYEFILVFQYIDHQQYVR